MWDLSTRKNSFLFPKLVETESNSIICGEAFIHGWFILNLITFLIIVACVQCMPNILFIKKWRIRWKLYFTLLLLLPLYRTPFSFSSTQNVDILNYWKTILVFVWFNQRTQYSTLTNKVMWDTQWWWLGLSIWVWIMRECISCRWGKWVPNWNSKRE